MSNHHDEIRQAINMFDMEKARQLLREELQHNPSAESYYLASLAALNEQQRLSFLQKAVELDPFHVEANQDMEDLRNINSKSGSTVESTSKMPAPGTSKTESALVLAVNRPSSFELADSSGAALVTGKISSATKVTLHHIPTTSGTVRTQMPIDAEVIILTRDEQVNWFNVVFTASTGQQLLGWVETKFVNTINILGNPVEILDMPITQFEWNSRDDIDTLIKAKTEPVPNLIGAILSLVAGVFIGLFSFALVVFEQAAVCAIGIFIGGGLIVYSMIALLKRLDRRASPSVVEIKQLKKIKQSKKPDSQKLMENQLIMAAMQTAMNVGTTIVTKMVPEKKDITIRNK